MTQKIVQPIYTPAGRLSFPHLYKKETEGQYASDKYCTTLLVPKMVDGKPNPEVKKFLATCLPVVQAEFGDKITFKELKHPFNDGDAKIAKYEKKGKDVEKIANLKGMYYLSASTKNKPKVAYRKDGQWIPIEEDDEPGIYAGCCCKLQVTPYAYSNSSDGMGIRLENVVKIKDDARFGGGGTADMDAGADGIEEYAGSDDAAVEYEDEDAPF